MLPPTAYRPQPNFAVPRHFAAAYALTTTTLPRVRRNLCHFPALCHTDLLTIAGGMPGRDLTITVFQHYRFQNYRISTRLVGF